MELKVHIIIDFMYLYYKYVYTIRAGRIKKLMAEIPHSFNVEGYETGLYDISTIYYPLKEIESIRKEFEKEGNDVTVSICFDAKAPERKEESLEYKSNRESNRLQQVDFDSIYIIRELLKQAGYNVYFREKTEADDLIYNIVRQYKVNFDFNVIYTPDTDIFINIDKNVGVCRYKGKQGYSSVGVPNYEKYCTEEFKCKLPYNSIMLYKCLCGDKSDKIDGIRGFGPSAFTKYINYLVSNSILEKLGILEFDKLNNSDVIRDLLTGTKDYFKDGQLEEALTSLSLVEPKVFDLDSPILKSTKELREKAYSQLNMKSLY